MATQSRNYQGESAENRISARRLLLLDTACTLMADNGWRNVTIDKLCQQAKLNKRYFYESFADLDDLAKSVVEDLSAQLMQVAMASAGQALASSRKAEQAPSSLDLARNTIRSVTSFLTQDPRRARVLFTEVSDNPAAIAVRKKAVKNLASAISAFGHEYHHAQKSVPAADVAASLVLGGTIEVIMQWLDGVIHLGFDELVEELAVMWVFIGDNTAARAAKKK